MKHNRYLGELGAELRLALPDDRAAELVAEIAGHLDETSGDPVDELGSPNELAKSLIAEQQVGHRRRVAIGVLTSILCAIGLTGMILLFGGSPLNLRELVPQYALAVLIGVFSVSLGGSMRDAFRGGDRRILMIWVASFAVLVMIGLVVQEEVLKDRLVEVPAARLLGLVLLVGAFAASFRVMRPLRFEPETGLKADALGRVRER